MNNPTTTTEQAGKKSKKPYLILLGFFLMLLLAFMTFLYVAKRKPKQTSNPDATPDIEPNERQEYAKELVELFIQSGLSDKEAKYWTALSAHETAGWTSELYNDNINLFGMKQPAERQTTSKGELNGYASYSDDEASIKDIILWIQAREFPIEHESLRKFTSELKAKKYYEADYMQYTNAVIKWHAQLFPKT
jgi:hypothetical protein